MQEQGLKEREFLLELNHLEAMFRVDGFKQYAWRKAKELDAQEGGMFAGIKDALAARVATKKEEE